MLSNLVGDLIDHVNKNNFYIKMYLVKRHL